MELLTTHVGCTRARVKGSRKWFSVWVSTFSLTPHSWLPHHHTGICKVCHDLCWRRLSPSPSEPHLQNSPATSTGHHASYSFKGVCYYPLKSPTSPHCSAALTLLHSLNHTLSALEICRFQFPLSSHRRSLTVTEFGATYIKATVTSPAADATSEL